MNHTYRLSAITEAQTTEIAELANTVFGRGTSLLISKRNMWGYYATDGKRIAGAVLLQKGSDQEGYLAWIFVAEHARGHRLASRLVEQGFKALDDAGLNIQFALVRDDNTASWNMFYKAGYKIAPLHKIIFGYSLKGLLKRLNYTLLTGYSIWVKDDSNKNPAYPKHPIIRTLVGASLIGAGIARFGLRDMEFLLISITMLLSVTMIRMLVAYPIARAYGRVRFMPSQGGFMLSFALALLTSSWWPTFGFFVPKEDLWKDADFKATIGKQALATWLALNAIFVGSAMLFNDLFTQGLHWFLVLILIYQSIPFIPFDAFDGGKVLRWNKRLYVTMVMITMITIAVTYVIYL
jgi:ribosomal protein S18 acetylase RimI-like enzyme